MPPRPSSPVFCLLKCCSGFQMLFTLQIFSIFLPLCDLQSFSGENSTVNWSRLFEVIFHDGMFQASLSLFLEVTVTYFPPCPQMTRKHNSLPVHLVRTLSEVWSLNFILRETASTVEVGCNNLKWVHFLTISTFHDISLTFLFREDISLNELQNF